MAHDPRQPTVEPKPGTPDQGKAAALDGIAEQEAKRLQLEKEAEARRETERTDQERQAKASQDAMAKRQDEPKTA